MVRQMNSVYHIPIIVYTSKGKYNMDVPTYYVEDEDIECVVDMWLRSNVKDYKSWELRRN